MVSKIKKRKQEQEKKTIELIRVDVEIYKLIEL